MLGAQIIGTGSYLPKRHITNNNLESMVNNFDEDKAGMPFCEWIKKVTGVQERYYISEGQTPETMGAEAAKQAIKSVNIKPEDIEYIIVSTFTSDLIANPSTTIGHLIGAEKAGKHSNQAINTACSGFVYALADALAYIRAGFYKTILVVATEALSRVTDFNDPKTAVLFGDGAGAAIIRATENKGILSQPFLYSTYSDNIKLKNPYIPQFQAANTLTPCEREYLRREYIQMPGGPKILRKAINEMGRALNEALRIGNYELIDIDYIIPHPANERIIIGFAENHPNNKVCNSIIQRYGNPSCAGTAITLDLMFRNKLEEYEPKPGDKIAITTVGGSYTSAAVIINV